MSNTSQQLGLKEHVRILLTELLIGWKPPLQTSVNLRRRRKFEMQLNKVLVWPGGLHRRQWEKSVRTTIIKHPPSSCQWAGLYPMFTHWLHFHLTCKMTPVCCDCCFGLKWLHFIFICRSTFHFSFVLFFKKHTVQEQQEEDAEVGKGWIDRI